MNNFDLLENELNKTEGIFTFKNDNITLGFICFNKIEEVEDIFVNPIFRKEGLAKRPLTLVKQKIGKKIILPEPMSPLGSKLIKSIVEWN